MVDVEAASGNRLVQPARALRIGEIFGKSDDVVVVLLTDGAAPRFELARVAGYEHEIVSVRGKDVGERGADADRAACD